MSGLIAASQRGGLSPLRNFYWVPGRGLKYQTALLFIRIIFYRVLPDLVVYSLFPLLATASVLFPVLGSVFELADRKRQCVHDVSVWLHAPLCGARGNAELTGTHRNSQELTGTHRN